MYTHALNMHSWALRESLFNQKKTAGIAVQPEENAKRAKEIVRKQMHRCFRNRCFPLQTTQAKKRFLWISQESLLNKKNAKRATELLRNVRLSCCVAGNVDLRVSEKDLLETLQLVSERCSYA